MKLFLICVSVCLLALVACEPAALPSAVVTETPTLHTPGPTVAELLRQPHTPGQSVEVDAYFSTGASMVGPAPLPGQVVCPVDVAFLADHPFPASLYVLNSVRGNRPPVGEPWLIPTSPESTKPETMMIPDLPYFARLRGHFDDPAFDKCQFADRIFVVETVVTTYVQAPAPTSVPGLQPPPDLATWAAYHNAAMGYRLPYPPGWSVQQLSAADPGVLSNVALRGPAWPRYPVNVRVDDHETFYDPDDPAHLPPLMQGGFGVFEQGWSYSNATPGGPHLAGYEVDRPSPATEQTITVFFNGGGRTYELTLTYPLGFDAPQPLLTAYTAMVEGFQLDVWPGPTATPPVKQALGRGPFLSQAEALARLRQANGPDLELLDAALISEAEARQGQSPCISFAGHPDGVWRMTVRGAFEGSRRTMRMLLDAATGAQLCGEEITPDSTPAPDHPGQTDTPVPTATAP